jgi:ABC-2 type transport system permease protein
MQIQYRGMLVIWLIYFVLKPVMYLSVWAAVARSTGGVVGTFSVADLAGYFLVIMWLVHLTFNGAFVFFEGRVRRGEFSPLLLRPIHPIVGDVAENMVYKALTAPLLALATVPLLLVFQPHIAPPAWAVLAFVPSVLLAYVVRFVTTWMVALSAFWLTRTQAVMLAYLLVLLFLGGEAAPLVLLPGWVQTLAWTSPFPWMLAFPAELVLGRLTASEAVTGLGMQVFWAAASVLLLAPCWRAAVRHYAAVGA